MINANLFMEILKDKNFYDLKKMEYKYGRETIKEVNELAEATIYKNVNIKDFNGKNLVYCQLLIDINDDTYKSLIVNKGPIYSKEKIENEIQSTLEIENIHSSRNSIRKIMQGQMPKTIDENKIYGIKRGLDFISNLNNSINEENLYKLYMATMGENIEDENKLIFGNYYRHDNVYVVGDKMSHIGLNPKFLPEYMNNFIKFINSDDGINKVIKSIIIHFYFAYIHPYFDGNGRMARLVHLWYLLQNGFNATLLTSFSNLIASTKNEYYKAFELVESNQVISGIIDVTPFISYFNKNVLNRIGQQRNDSNILREFKKHLDKGIITPKERELFMFVLSSYGGGEFSTKQLEKDFRDAAYATIRSFVMKFEEIGLLSSQKYTNRVKYRANVD